MADRLLVVEDEALVADMLRLNLAHAGYDVVACADGRHALEVARGGGFAGAIVDVMLPGMDGLEIVRTLRKEGWTTPVMMLTARAEIESRVAGLDAGADDYLPKPFAMPELLARVRALVRRSVAPVATPREIRFDRYHVNLETREALTNEGLVTLTETECALLQYLWRREGEAPSRTEILEDAWGMDRFPTERTVDNYVLRLRRLFEPEPEAPRHFITVRGKGYRFAR